MRIAIVINAERVLATPKFRSLQATVLGQKTIFEYLLEDIEDRAGFARLKSFVSSKIADGLKAVLVCQPWIDGNDKLDTTKNKVGDWLDHLTTRGIQCLHRTYNPTSGAACDTVIEFISDFPVKYSKTIEEMLDSPRLLTTTETAAILSEHYRNISARDTRRLQGLRHEKRGQRSLGFRESDVALFIKNNT
jgi:hypothetical protein